MVSKKNERKIKRIIREDVLQTNQSAYKYKNKYFLPIEIKKREILEYYRVLFLRSDFVKNFFTKIIKGKVLIDNKDVKFTNSEYAILKNIGITELGKQIQFFSILMSHGINFIDFITVNVIMLLENNQEYIELLYREVENLYHKTRSRERAELIRQKKEKIKEKIIEEKKTIQNILYN